MVRRAIKLTKGTIEREEPEILPESISSRSHDGWAWHHKLGAGCAYVWRLDEKQGELIAREVTGSCRSEARQVAHRLGEALEEFARVHSSRKSKEENLRYLVDLRDRPEEAKFDLFSHPIAFAPKFMKGQKGRLKEAIEEYESEIRVLKQREEDLKSEITPLKMALGEILQHMEGEGWYRISLGVVKEKGGMWTGLTCART